MKYTIELTSKQKNQMDFLMELAHRYIGFNPKFEDIYTTNIEDTKEYQIGYKTGYNIAQNNAQATKEDWGKIEYQRGLEDGKNQFMDCQGVINNINAKALGEFENLFVYENDYKEFFLNVYTKHVTLYNAVAKYGIAKVVADFMKWKEEKKNVEDYHKLVDTLRTVTDEYPRETIVSALSEFGIEVNESEEK